MSYMIYRRDIIRPQPFFISALQKLGLDTLKHMINEALGQGHEYSKKNHHLSQSIVPVRVS
jgi:hypothetical protein